MLLLGLGLLAIAAAQSLMQLCALSVVVGLTASMAQDCVPAAAALAPQAVEENRRKRDDWTLAGILLSRVVSGYVTERFGWRTMFVWPRSPSACFTSSLSADCPKLFQPRSRICRVALVRFSHCGVVMPAYGAPLFAQLLLSAASALLSTLAIMLGRPPFSYGAQ